MTTRPIVLATYDPATQVYRTPEGWETGSDDGVWWTDRDGAVADSEEFYAVDIRFVGGPLDKETIGRTGTIR